MLASHIINIILGELILYERNWPNEDCILEKIYHFHQKYAFVVHKGVHMQKLQLDNSCIEKFIF